MKVLEIKNNLVKISYNREDNLLLSGFVIIEDSQTPYVAQVLSLKADNGINYAIVKLLFTFDSEGIVKNYDGTIPSLDSDVTKLSSDELLDIMPVNHPVEIGMLASQDVNLKVDRSVLEQNLLICSENKENTNTAIENFVFQLSTENYKSVIFDIDGKFPGQKLKFGKDFKLPLNYDTINFIYEHDLDNVEPASKALIQDIFLEVQEYSKTVLDKFIPFDTFINVVDQQYKALGLTELVLLKNKLLKYREENVFAQNAKEIHTLRSAIRANLTNILDISSASDILQNEIIKYVYDSIDEMDLFVYSFVSLNNDNADKKLIRHFLTKNKIYTTIACSHNFKYLYELKERAGNLILFAPQTLQHDFASYNTFLNKLNTDEFIIYGKATQHVPLIIELTSILEREDEQTQDVPQEHTNIQTEPEEEQVTTEEPDDFSDESNSYSYETLISDDTPVQQEQEESETEDNIEESQTQEEIQPQVISDIIDKEIAEEKEPAPLPEIIEEAPENYSEDLPDVFKNPPDETLLQEAPIEIEEEVPPPVSESFIDGNIIEESEEPPAPVINYDDTSLPIISENELHEKTEEANITPAIQDNAAEVVDEIMFSKPNVDIPPIDEEFDEEALTEDDLNFIEDVNIGTPEIAEEVNVPVYPAETPVKAEIPVFEQGDRVTHPKYGEGVVEKMIKYGNKTLCSINFVNIGRRLLDPAISEIEKV
ncbi:TPA: hypothetical protein IAC10_06130 [Candidatus Scatousia excrementigallinarum]|uniref:Uncharacterized protein n=1 Tax=Candidatus Scatousia excrementigallinarum TaxID=2840935 RepID=A0A9D1EZ90_9BACT|nr:hypothetical protein [Candidatus Scatousia excrementigallinarum]